MSALELVVASATGRVRVRSGATAWLRAANVTGAELLAMGRGMGVRAVVDGQLVELTLAPAVAS